MIHQLEARHAYREGDEAGCNAPGTAEVVAGCEQSHRTTCPDCNAWLDRQPLYPTKQASA